jgi:hypothetical protein
MSVCVYSVFVLSCVGSGLANVYEIHSSKLNLVRNRLEGQYERYKKKKKKKKKKKNYKSEGGSVHRKH